MQILNPFGLLNNDLSKIVHVNEVDAGLNCNCYCPKCHSKLIAVHGAQKQWHFRHYNVEDCEGSFETAVHYLAKHVLVEKKEMRFPYLKVRTSRELWSLNTNPIMKETVFERKLVRFDDVEDEVWMDGYIPDIVASLSGIKYLIEIVVTHDVSPDKLEWIRKKNIGNVRVDFSWAGYGINKSIISQCLYEGRAVIYSPRFNIVEWVHHPHEADAQARVNEQFINSAQGALDKNEKPKQVQLKLDF